MDKRLSLTFFLFLFLVTLHTINSQNRLFGFRGREFGFTNEVGVFGGFYNLRGDFGERGSREVTTNTGYAIGIKHYFNFAYRKYYNQSNFEEFLNEHFKIRSEISYNQTDMKHYGKFVEESRTGEDNERLRRHTGKAQNFNIGVQADFYPFEVRRLEDYIYSFVPIISFGMQFTWFNPSVYTTYGDGDINNLDNFYLPWQVDEDPFLSTDSGTTFSIVGGIGGRFKVTKLTDITLDLRWQWYFDDFVDGLDHKLQWNKKDDWAVWFTMGYVIYWER
jgi:hypothetical protein